MEERFQNQLARRGDLEERFEGVEDQLRRKDEVINDLTTTVNEMKTKLQVRIRITKTTVKLTNCKCVFL